MIANTLFTAGAFASLVAAIPMGQFPHQKRDIVWETHTEVAVTTIPVTVTHWLEPGESAPTGAPLGKQHWGHGGHGHGHGGYGGYGSPPAAQPETTQSVAPVAPASSPQSSPEAPPAPSAYVQPSSQAPSPPPAYTAPAPSSVEAAPAPAPTTTTSEAPAPPAYTPQTSAAPTSEPQTSAAPAPQSSAAPSYGGGSSAPSGESYSGDITHYDVAAGLGSCGEMHSNSENVVALSAPMMSAAMGSLTNTNDNPLCGKTITIEYDGEEHTAQVVDTCPGCSMDSLDLSPTLFTTVAPNGNGRVSDVKWWFSN